MESGKSIEIRLNSFIRKMFMSPLIVEIMNGIERANGERNREEKKRKKGSNEK